MKRIIVVLLLATAFVYQGACKSADQTNAPANSNAPNATSNAAAPNTANVAPNQNAAIKSSNANAAANQFTELMMLYTQLFTARMKNNREKAADILADDYKETTADGKALNKEQVLAEISPDKKVDMYSLDDINSTTNGDTGVVTGRASVTTQGKTEGWQFSATFKKSNGQWKAVSQQLTNYKKS